MTPRQPIGAGRQAQRPDMGRHMRAIGQERHGVIGKAGGDLHAHEDSGDDGGPFGAGLGAGMAAPQEDVIAGPDAMVMRTRARLCAGVPMIMAMTMIVSVVMPMVVPM